VSETSLRDLVKSQLRDGRLPRASPRRVYGGLGIGALCKICGRPVGADQNELQLLFIENMDSLSIVVLHLHAPCYAAWELERSE
jgi:hypothetical protein